jgi:hypothetical protein
MNTELFNSLTNWQSYSAKIAAQPVVQPPYYVHVRHYSVHEINMNTDEMHFSPGTVLKQRRHSEPYAMSNARYNFELEPLDLTFLNQGFIPPNALITL